ncbi:glycoside hydrolase family 47 protein [Patellaria atrata CBS 101060]|uniref:alpha-1,2-Mannosidase n=1 Tax=Patellaria atrata CBS 101060 TaxID=1346257 RepID=A0A9P4S5V5_9PEZI|nr:glycoside hydrolase family 47 protein [Patellaria atrata CBS 101060]
MGPFLRRWVLVCIIFLCFIFGTLHLNTLPQLNQPYLPGGEPHGLFASKVRWKDIPQQHPVATIIPLPTGIPPSIPRIQYEFTEESIEEKLERQRRLQAVKETLAHSWEGYRNYAWMHDEVAPLTNGTKDGFGGWGATLVDAMDTLWIAGMKKEFEQTVKALKKIDFTTSGLDELNLFETIIRYLGGFLSAYDLSEGKYPLLLEKATELGEMVYHAFDTPNRMPMTRWYWKKLVLHTLSLYFNWRAKFFCSSAMGEPQEASHYSLAAELGSFSLEFTRLSQLTGDSKWYDAAQRVMDVFYESQNMTKLPGLWPVNLNALKKKFYTDTQFTLGGMADSLYEYLPKEHLLLGGVVDQYRIMYEGAIEAAKKHLFFRPLNSQNANLLFSGTVYVNGARHLTGDHEGQHLACFTGGMVALGAKLFNRKEDLKVARQLTDGCIWAYESMPTGIMPESCKLIPCEEDDCTWSEQKWYTTVAKELRRGSSGEEPVVPLEQLGKRYVEKHHLQPGFLEVNDPRYLLRPEAIESVFVLYRITGDKTLQDHAWKMFQNINSLTKTKIGHGALQDVTVKNTTQNDESESFWMAETLKYFYLIFSEPNVVSLDEYVFNTEAHPLRRPKH